MTWLFFLSAQVVPGLRGGIRLGGQQSDYSGLVIDGADATNNYFGENFGSLETKNLTVPLEAVQEFQVVTNGFAPEFGRATGGLLNVVTKSGTNAVHGEAHEYYRGGSLTANDALGEPSNIQNQNQFGGSVGLRPSGNRRPKLRIVAPNASPEEAAAVVAALERFMRGRRPRPELRPPSSRTRGSGRRCSRGSRASRVRPRRGSLRSLASGLDTSTARLSVCPREPGKFTRDVVIGVALAGRRGRQAVPDGEDALRRLTPAYSGGARARGHARGGFSVLGSRRNRFRFGVLGLLALALPYATLMSATIKAIVNPVTVETQVPAITVPLARFPAISAPKLVADR